ncbi:hypothetical protein [Rhizobium leguminosarum]|uniref:hypothetical protein n=1 Tax=Rhizobium leguminosarum TaxID=384 RepID=UPI00102FBA8F|nr:hypothetical protein [Rhizobium leguminosarum]TAX39141.1 hypothetical protein ELI05_09350 [Rhizobium leguminosarum]
MEDIEDWLDEKIDEIVHTPGLYEDASYFEREAEGLKAAAKSDGIAEADLIDACGGDIAKYIMNRQNAYTMAHIKSQDD